MAEFPYTIAPKVFKRFVQEIPSTEVPEKLSQIELVARGYKSHNYRTFIPILKFVKFLDDTGKPTDNWVNYRDKALGGAVMASCIRSAYSDLFKIHANAQDKDTEALRSFFSTRVKGSQNVLDMTVGTFKALCELGDFKAERKELSDDEEEEEKEERPLKKGKVQQESGVIVNLNIQLTLPATENADIYDKFFAAMKKHLFESKE